MVDAQRVAVTLRPWLGADALSRMDVCERIAQRLSGFDARGGDFEALRSSLDRLLFLSLRQCTSGDMKVLLDDGRLMRVRVDDIAQMADEVTYLRFCALPRTGWYCEKLRAYALSGDSLAALRALYVDFRGFHAQEELLLLRRTIRECHMPYRWRSWLGED